MKKKEAENGGLSYVVAGVGLFVGLRLLMSAIWGGITKEKPSCSQAHKYGLFSRQGDENI